MGWPFEISTELGQKLDYRSEEREFCDEIWNYWLDNEYEVMRVCKLTFVDGTKASSEMVLLRKLYSARPRIDTFFPGRIVSYKAHIKPQIVPIEVTSMVYFHGQPKPHELTEDWVKVHWR